jgi:hypothetical protein
MKKHVSVLLIVSGAILLIAGCGGGGGGGGTVQLCIQVFDYWNADNLNPPTSSNLVDTYNLVGCDIDVWEDGVFWGTLDESIYWQYIGTMNIQAATITQNITIDGDSFAQSGSYTVTTAGPTSGTIYITDPFGSYVFDFDISGNTLIWDSDIVCTAVAANQVGVEPLAAGMSDHIKSLRGDMFMY